VNVLDLFSGIGGFSIGLERAGMRTVAFCEIDPAARIILGRHWPGVPVYDDVRAVTAARLAGDGIGPVDVICGGFPCQDISVAGTGAGLAGERSGLWHEFARIIGDVRPRYVLVENVAALLGRGMGQVLGSLAALGYDAEWHCIPAAAVGAPHRRDRVWIVAADADRGGFQGIGQSQHGQQQRTPRREPDRLGARGWRDGAADVADAERERREVGCRLLGPLARALTTVAAPWERPSEPPICGVDDGIPGWAHRIRCLGNAVVPQIPEIIGRELMALAAGEPQT